ncbi:MAG: ACP S-malonyltransferase [Brevinematia bacterium]
MGRRVILVFPGQGAQYVGMGKEIYEEFWYVREFYEKASTVINVDLKKLIFEGNEEELKKTANAQPSIFLTSAVMLEVFRREVGDKVEVLACAGHSLGEYSALYCAGVFSFEDAVKVVRRRGEIMSNADPEGKGGMSAVIGLEPQKVKEICDELMREGKYVEPVNYNSPEQVVISGYKEHVKEAGERLKSAGAKRVVELAVSGAFHSKLMQGPAKVFREFLETININPPAVTVFANYNAKPFPSSRNEIIEIMEKQMYSPVLWTDITRELSLLKPDLIIEVGPGQVLRGLVKKTLPDLEIESFSLSLLERLLKDVHQL